MWVLYISVSCLLLDILKQWGICNKVQYTTVINHQYLRVQIGRIEITQWDKKYFVMPLLVLGFASVNLRYKISAYIYVYTSKLTLHLVKAEILSHSLLYNQHLVQYLTYKNIRYYWINKYFVVEHSRRQRILNYGNDKILVFPLLFLYLIYSY